MVQPGRVDCRPPDTCGLRQGLLAGFALPDSHQLGFQRDDTAVTLKQTATQLARLNGWLRLQSSVTDDSEYPVSPGFATGKNRAIAEDQGKSYKGEFYKLMLQARGDTRISPRWVYVLTIDCQGNGN